MESMSVLEKRTATGMLVHKNERALSAGAGVSACQWPWPGRWARAAEEGRTAGDAVWTTKKTARRASRDKPEDRAGRGGRARLAAADLARNNGGKQYSMSRVHLLPKNRLMTPAITSSSSVLPATATPLRASGRRATDACPTRAAACPGLAMATAPPSARRVGPRSIQSFASSNADKSTAAPNRPPPAKPVTLAKRILFPTLPPDADLPPLLLSPAAAPELNAELYDFIALALRAYVNTWWTKITRYDKEFLPEITRILTVVMRTLEARLVATDLSPLVFRDLPTLLAQHWTDYRNAQAKLHTSYAAGGAASLAQLFHQMQPHMALSPDGVVDPVYVRQAVDHILKTCLPPEDYEPETERYIVREIILKVLVGSVLPRITQPWFIHKVILDQLGPENAAGKVPEVSALPGSMSGCEFGRAQLRRLGHACAPIYNALYLPPPALRASCVHVAV